MLTQLLSSIAHKPTASRDNPRPYTSLHRLCLCAALCTTLLSGHTLAQNTDAKAQENQARIAELAASIEQLKAELNQAKDSKNQLEKTLQQSEEETAALSKKVDTIKEALAREKKLLARLRAQHQTLKAQQGEQQQLIAQAIRQRYQLGQQSHIKLLINQEQPERLSRLVKYHGYVVNAQQQQITRYSKMLTDLANTTQQIETKTQYLNQQQQQLNQQQRSLASTHRKRQSSLSKLNQSLKKKGQQLNKFIADRSRLQQLLEDIQQALAKLKQFNGDDPFSKARGKLPMPTAGKIIHRYGSKQFDGKLKRNGIVISNQAGSQVSSVHHGRVIFSDYLRGYGLLLIIDHGDGYMSLYGHNQTLLREIGDWVQTGESIATVGNSGGQASHALYFEIRHQGNPQNPHRWLNKQ